MLLKSGSQRGASNSRMYLIELRKNKSRLWVLPWGHAPWLGESGLGPHTLNLRIGSRLVHSGYFLFHPYNKDCDIRPDDRACHNRSWIVQWRWTTSGDNSVGPTRDVARLERLEFRKAEPGWRRTHREEEKERR